MERLTFLDNGKPAFRFRDAIYKIDVAAKLAAYEDTGLEPDDVIELMAENATAIGQLAEYRVLAPIKHLRELVQAEKDGRLVVLPCKDDIVYTIEEDYFSCDACEHKNNAHYQPDIARVSCDMENVHCPLYIKAHTVSGFEISFYNGHATLSAPGEWGYEGLESFSGLDGKWYLTHKEAEAALEAMKGERHETDL